jgi:polysaccharide biosynthesis transport protein
MLHSQSFPVGLDLPPADERGQRGASELVDWALGFLLRRYLVILLLVLLGGVSGAIFLVIRPLTYTAQAKILIGKQKPQFMQQQALLADAPFDQSQMETQFQILLSSAILAPIVKKLELFDDPEFSSPSGGLLRRMLQVFTGPTSSETKLDPTETAIATLVDRLSINRVGSSFLIEIGASSRNPEKAAQIANAVTQAYIDDQQEVKQQANEAASTWLQERLRQLREQTLAAERAVVAFKQQRSPSITSLAP